MQWTSSQYPKDINSSYNSISKKHNPIKKWAEDLNKHFFKGDMQMANRHVKRCPTPRLPWEMQIKTVMRYRFTPARGAIIKSSIGHKCWRRCGETGALLRCWWECKLMQPPGRAVWRFLKKLKIGLPHDPVIPLPNIYRKDGNFNSRKMHAPQ